MLDCSGGMLIRVPIAPVSARCPVRHLRSWCVLLWASALLLGGCRADRSPTIGEILSAHPERFAALTGRAEELRLQIVLSEVVGPPERPFLSRSTYRARAEYFYPASTIKLCAAVAAVAELENLQQHSRGDTVTLDTPLCFHPLFAGETLRDRDPSNIDSGNITLRHEIRKLFLVSDNEAFNRLYEFVGHSRLNEAMRRLGLETAVLNHRLSVGRTAEENRRSPRIDLGCRPGSPWIPERTSDLLVRNADMPGLQVGRGYLASGGRLVLEPMDFTPRNGIAIDQLQDLLIMLVRPDIRTGPTGLALSPDHREFLARTMAEYPADSANPRYDREAYPDDWGKFFLPGLVRVGGRTRHDLTICNKIGQAYGFTIDNAYIVDHRTGRAFFLTAAIYTNGDGILNDDAYEYESVALPFMADLAEQVARAIWREPGRAER